MRIPMMLASALAGSLLALPANAQYADAARSLAATCTGCHGTEGRSQAGMPALAGQPKENLLRQMLDFKSGKRPATVMHQHAKGYTDQQIEVLADYFSKQKTQ
jgi:sulfide dehydrogenase cytochrome subunit